MFYLGQDSSLNIPRMPFFPNWKSFFLPISHWNIEEIATLQGIHYHLRSLFPSFSVEDTNFILFVFASRMLLLFLVLFFNTQNINRALLGNERATAKLFFNLMKSELEKDKLHQLKWQEMVKDWKLIQKICVVQSFRSEILQSYFGRWITQSDWYSSVVSIK